jgi:membrane fusion protein, multidrug efflux system
MKRAVVSVGVLVAIAAIAMPKLLPLLRTKSAPPAATMPAGKEAGKKAGGGAPLRVETVTLLPMALAETISSTGTLRAEEGVELQAETNGKVVSINFNEGGRVHRGDLLLRLNDAELRATLQRAAYRRELAEIRERRLARLIETKSVNQQDYDVALSELSVQRSEVALVEAQLAKLEIRAPFDGVVGLRFVSEGAFVNATTRVATLQRLDNLKIDFSVPEKYAGRIRIGSPITFTVAGGDQQAKGEIYAYDPRIDVTTRTLLIRALCPNPELRLLPGAFANVEIVLDQLNDALLVPAVAVVPGLSEKNVFVIDDGKAVRRAVEIGMRTESMVQILSGLKAGDTVITSGLQQMRSGLPVRAMTANGDENSAAPQPKPVREGRVQKTATVVSTQ